MDAWLQVLSTLAAAVIGGVIAPQITQARERRAARALVRERIADVESLRWLEDPYLEYKRALAALEAAALIARVPRDVVQRYMQAADAARSVMEEAPGAGPNGEDVSFMPDGPETLAHAKSLDQLSAALWHPWLARLSGISRRLRK
ncbi:hypothetical protein E1295_44330 [Nonomuraea mesophila]|uniref:Uncharacterized protein n=1 Tax=Nonomuraea mesophila TaxID=2530382 RepID=A0A4R5E6H9_9ACTN|nr:hypothetical protein [Nonomuraea mesophila]TDE26424.1 hypothetical protein E1295_44330 [Nonomuraea mesophila]